MHKILLLTSIIFCLVLCNLANSIPLTDLEALFTDPTESCVIPLTLYDIQHYAFIIDFQIPGTDISVKLDITLQTLTAIDTIKLDLVDLTVDSIFMEGFPLSFHQESGVLFVNLPETALPGMELILTIFYHGNPTDGYTYRYNRHGNPIYSTLFWASTARYFYPCIDHPADKATCDIIGIVPPEYDLASVGILVSDSIDTEADKRIFHWIMDYPICTYNICFSICDYNVVIDSVDTLPIYYYVYPESEENALFDLGRTPEILEFFSSIFGSYPFKKYGVNLAPNVGGGMEHQTMVTLDQLLIDGRRSYEWLFMHELCHQWFGDAVGIADWREFWLSEGFAVYSEVLMTEYFEGPDEAKEYIQSLQGSYTTHEGGEGRFPIYDPEVYLGYTIYKKSPCVLHNLRFVMGDSSFFHAINEYYYRFRYGNTTTPDLQQVCEEFYGDSLNWFFNQWIYDQGYPEFTYSYRFISSPIPEEKILRFIITQVQYDAPLFIFPLEIQIFLTTYDFYDTLFVNDSVDTFDIPIPFTEEVEDIDIDPNAWMIESYREVSAIQETKPLLPEFGLSIFPNPTNTTANILVKNELGNFFRIEIFNLFGEKVYTLFNGYLPHGEHHFLWQGDIRGDLYGASIQTAPSGIYFCGVMNKGQLINKEKIILIK